MSEQDTKERILDAAEQRFARDGFHGTSLRAITAEAGANLAAVNYHFGSKETLMAAVIDRRLAPLNRRRSECLEAVAAAARKENRPPDVRGVLRAFIQPTLDFRGSCPGAEAFVTLVGRALVQPDDTLRVFFQKRMEPVVTRLFESLAAALPALPRQVLFWRLHFMLGAMSHTLCWIDRAGRAAPAGLEPSADAETLSDLLLDFLTAGMESTS